MDKPDINRFFSAQPKIRQLMLLIALDQYRNIHRASEVLHLTQPAVSKQLKDLEELLGVVLFERLPRGMEPTIYGSTMIRYAKIVLSNLSMAKDDIQALKLGLTGKVKLGTIAVNLSQFLPQAILRLRKEAPGLGVEVDVDVSTNLIESLNSDSCDLIICNIPREQDVSNLIVHALPDQGKCVVVSRKDHPVVACEEQSLRSLCAYAWIAPPNNSIMRKNINNMFQLAGLDAPKFALETNDQLVELSMLQQSDFLSVMPIGMAQHYESQQLLGIVPCELPWPQIGNGYGIVHRADKVLSPGANLLLKAVCEEAELNPPN
jgi:DNA-binding transcriptional LysR family regulator